MSVESNGKRLGLVQSIERWAASSPDLIALHFDGESITYRDLNLRANRVANGLEALGVEKGDRVAIMLPNIPEFVYALLGILKLGAVAVPFNTLYKGGEILHILKDSGAKVLIALTNFAPMINEIRPELPALEQVILTGERNLLFAHPESTAFIQLILQRDLIRDVDGAYQKMGHILLKIMEDLGVKEAWYKHRGSIRVRGTKIATFVIFEVEGIALVNAVVFLGPMDTKAFLRVVWVPPEIRDKVIEPLTSVEQETGQRPSWDQVKETVVAAIQQAFQVEIKEGSMVRDERFGYEKLRSLAYKAR
ncbi:MAG: AMP-binding protein [Deltaproteobacteria bacterium]|nr:AMP-binding protein [Deltaproteobacteria bacterium]MBW2074724.1 AMP-binding protein [Deltaproteobacteria bacterium]